MIKRTSALVLFFDVKIYWRQISLLVGVDMVPNYFASHEHNAYSCKDTCLLLMGHLPTRPAFPHHEEVYFMGICSSHDDDDDDDAMATKKDALPRRCE